jgi:hypothetical protein
MTAEFFFRPNHNDHKFLASCPSRGPFDVALLRGRYLAPHPAGSPSAVRGSNGRELIERGCLRSRVDFVVDPDSSCLAQGSRSALGRTAAMAHAQVLDALGGLPVTPVVLAASADRRSFVAAALGVQAGARELVAPYFRWAQKGDAWFRLNLEMLVDTVSMAGSRGVAAFVHAPIDALASGDIADAAPAYAAAGARRVFLRIAGFDPAMASTAQLAAYRRAVDAYAAQGLLVVADAVGRFGLVLCSAGAAGFSSGSRNFHLVPEDEISLAEEMWSDEMGYEVPGRWFSVPWNQACRDLAAGVTAPCPQTSCDALAGPTRVSAKLTEHFVHLMVSEVRLAAAGGTARARGIVAMGPYRRWTAAA